MIRINLISQIRSRKQAHLHAKTQQESSYGTQFSRKWQLIQLVQAPRNGSVQHSRINTSTERSSEKSTGQADKKSWSSGDLHTPMRIAQYSAVSALPLSTPARSSTDTDRLAADWQNLVQKKPTENVLYRTTPTGTRQITDRAATARTQSMASVFIDSWAAASVATAFETDDTNPDRVRT